MADRTKLRRSAILCCNCTRNIAYHSAGWIEDDLIGGNCNICRTINGNFLDVAVMEWCKLFDPKEKHYWHKTVSDHNAFKTGLFAELGIDDEAWSTYFGKMRTYRDKFLAHLDHEPTMHLPDLDIARNSTAYYYRHIVQHENDGNTFEDGPSDMFTYYEQCAYEANKFYNSYIGSMGSE